MAEIAELKKLNRPQLEALAHNKGVADVDSKSDHELAKELAPAVTADDVKKASAGSGVEPSDPKPPIGEGESAPDIHTPIDADEGGDPAQSEPIQPAADAAPAAEDPAASAATSGSAPTQADAEAEQLADSKTRKQLETLAKKQDVADPKQYPNKVELAKAILDTGYEPIDGGGKKSAKADEPDPEDVATQPLPVLGGVGPVIEVPVKDNRNVPVNEVAQELASRYDRKTLANLAGARNIANANDVSAYPNSTTLANALVRGGYQPNYDEATMGLSNNQDEEQK